VSNQNFIHNEIKSKVNSGGVCCNSVPSLPSSRALSTKVKYKTLILMYGCETWSLTLRDEHRRRIGRDCGPIILNLGTRWWSVSCSGRFTPRETVPCAHFIQGWVCLRYDLDVMQEVLGSTSHLISYDRTENDVSKNCSLFWLHYFGFQELGRIHRHTDSKGDLINLFFYSQNKESKPQNLFSCQESTLVVCSLYWLSYPGSDNISSTGWEGT
jgi:hypothetical protein